MILYVGLNLLTNMAKSRSSRHHTERLRNKWLKLLKGMDIGIHEDALTFGKIFSQDPLDCGNPRCGICSMEKVHQRKLDRVARRKEERKESLNF